MGPAELYYEQANPDLLYRIPVNAQAVLEVGCGAGALGRAYKAINPLVYYIGVELMPGPARQARLALDQVIEGDISKDTLVKLPDNIKQVDCLVFGDVLEHLVDPSTVLQQLLPLLKDNGMLLICIPNVQHWSVIANLLSGLWPQEEQGLFDRTHLRWFTKKSLIELITEVGLQVQDITPRIFRAEKAKEFISAIQPALTNLKLDPQTVLNGTAPLQYVVRASKTVNPIQISGIMMAPQAGMNEVRMIQPLRSVASLPGVTVQLSSNSIGLLPRNSMVPRIMIWQRQLLTYEKSLARIRQVLRAGYILISEFDDDPDHWPAIRENKNLNFTAVHAVQVSTEILQNKLSKINPEVEVFDNCLEQIPEHDPKKWDGAGISKPLKIFFGALNRQESWEEWIGPLNQVLCEFPRAWHVEVIHDETFFQKLATDQKSFTPTCNYSTYLSKLKQSHIALLPLKSTPFNHQKSDLKFVEAAGCEVAAIASPTAYSKTIQHNITGVICSSGVDLKATLESWKNKPEQPFILATNAREWCLSNRLQQTQSERRLRWYRSLWERREELTKALMQRVPELAN